MKEESRGTRMNKHVEKVQKGTKFLIGLFLGFGILFLCLLILFIVTTSQYPLIIVLLFLFFSVFFFLMAYWQHRFIKRLVENNGWMKLYDTFRILYIASICVIIGELFLISVYLVIRWYFGKELMSPGFVYMRGVRMVMWCVMFIVAKNVMRLYKGYEIKSFPDWSENGLEFLAKALEHNSIPIRSIGRKKCNFWLRFDEIFELPNGIVLRFRIPKKVDPKVDWIHPRSGFDFTVEVGPKREGNEKSIRKIKTIVDGLDDRYWNSSRQL